MCANWVMKIPLHIFFDIFPLHVQVFVFVFFFPINYIYLYRVSLCFIMSLSFCFHSFISVDSLVDSHSVSYSFHSLFVCCRRCMETRRCQLKNTKPKTKKKKNNARLIILWDQIEFPHKNYTFSILNRQLTYILTIIHLRRVCLGSRLCWCEYSSTYASFIY